MIFLNVWKVHWDCNSYKNTFRIHFQKLRSTYCATFIRSCNPKSNFANPQQWGKTEEQKQRGNFRSSDPEPENNFASMLPRTRCPQTQAHMGSNFQKLYSPNFFFLLSNNLVKHARYFQGCYNRFPPYLPTSDKDLTEICFSSTIPKLILQSHAISLSSGPSTFLASSQHTTVFTRPPENFWLLV